MKHKEVNCECIKYFQEGYCSFVNNFRCGITAHESYLYIMLLYCSYCNIVVVVCVGLSITLTFTLPAWLRTWRLVRHQDQQSIKCVQIWHRPSLANVGGIAVVPMVNEPVKGAVHTLCYVTPFKD